MKYFAISRGFSLRDDDVWRTTGKHIEKMRTDILEEALDWMRGRTAPDLGVWLYENRQTVWRKHPGGTDLVPIIRPASPPELDDFRT